MKFIIIIIHLEAVGIFNNPHSARIPDPSQLDFRAVARGGQDVGGDPNHILDALAMLRLEAANLIGASRDIVDDHRLIINRKWWWGHITVSRK